LYTINNREIITDNFDALYALLKPKGVTVSAMLAKAVAETLKKYPIINAAYVQVIRSLLIYMYIFCLE
jgi:pyruvate dehydrogenase E2 component (dihydrolipoamide acetyltransferase)